MALPTAAQELPSVRSHHAGAGKPTAPLHILFIVKVHPVPWAITRGQSTPQQSKSLALPPSEVSTGISYMPLSFLCFSSKERKQHSR